MTDHQSGQTEGVPESAQQTIARQAAEIESLRSRLADERFAEELRRALALASTAGTVSSPVSHARLLEMIVETAAQVIAARAASLFLINEETQELTFEVALGQKAQAVKKFTVPMGYGIAGLVAVTGQPLAVSDASKDPRQAADIARSVGYTPDNILCVPLFYNDQIIGVLELLDKEGANSFSPNDMEVLSLFANLAAVAIEQSRTHRNLAALIGEVLHSLGGADGDMKGSLQGGLSNFVQGTEGNNLYKQSLGIAELVHEIVWRGENEAAACQVILEGFAEYLRKRSDTSGDFGLGL